MKLLLKHKADCTIANKKKELPLHRACASNSNIEVGVPPYALKHSIVTTSVSDDACRADP